MTTANNLKTSTTISVAIFILLWGGIFFSLSYFNPSCSDHAMDKVTTSYKLKSWADVTEANDFQTEHTLYALFYHLFYQNIGTKLFKSPRYTYFLYFSIFAATLIFIAYRGLRQKPFLLIFLTTIFLSYNVLEYILHTGEDNLYYFPFFLLFLKLIASDKWDWKHFMLSWTVLTISATGHAISLVLAYSIFLLPVFLISKNIKKSINLTLLIGCSIGTTMILIQILTSKLSRWTYVLRELTFTQSKDAYKPVYSIFSKEHLAILAENFTQSIVPTSLFENDSTFVTRSFMLLLIAPAIVLIKKITTSSITTEKKIIFAFFLLMSLCFFTYYETESRERYDLFVLVLLFGVHLLPNRTIFTKIETSIILLSLASCFLVKFNNYIHFWHPQKPHINILNQTEYGKHTEVFMPTDKQRHTPAFARTNFYNAFYKTYLVNCSSGTLKIYHDTSVGRYFYNHPNKNLEEYLVPNIKPTENSYIYDDIKHCFNRNNTSQDL